MLDSSISNDIASLSTKSLCLERLPIMEANRGSNVFHSDSNKSFQANVQISSQRKRSERSEGLTTTFKDLVSPPMELQDVGVDESKHVLKIWLLKDVLVPVETG